MAIQIQTKNMIVINFKTYPEVTLNNNILKIIADCENVFNQYKVPIIFAVQASDIYKVRQNTSLPVFAQHIDPVEPGKNTGFTTWMAIKENGAIGVILNHSEHRIGMENIKKTLEICQRENLETLVCVENTSEALEIDKYNPDMIALEDPVLIGGDVSIVKNEAGKIKVQEFIAQNLKAKCLVGAGVKNQEDIRVSLSIGASGVLLASGIAKATNPREILEDLCQGFK